MKTILIIDDNKSIREALEFALEAQGHQIVSSDMYHKELLSNPPDLIILDMLLSGHYGPDVCREIKNDPNSSDVPVVMISAHPNAQEAIDNCGADGFIPKPFELDGLLATVEKHLT